MEEPLVNFEVKGLSDEQLQKLKEFLESMQKEHPEYGIRDIKLEKKKNHGIVLEHNTTMEAGNPASFFCTKFGFHTYGIYRKLDKLRIFVKT